MDLLGKRRNPSGGRVESQSPSCQSLMTGVGSSIDNTIVFLHSAMDSSQTALLLSQDLLISSQITGKARQLGIEIDVIGSTKQLAERSQLKDYRVLFVDLGTDESIAEVVAALPIEQQIAVVAYGSHVHTIKLEAARQAGCDEVMSRGQFSATFAEVLQRYVTHE